MQDKTGSAMGPSQGVALQQSSFRQPIADGLTFCISVPFLLPFLKELKEQGDEE